LAADGHKLSKQNGAAALDLQDTVAVLRAALRTLDMPAEALTPAELLQAAVPAWGRRWADSTAATAVPGAAFVRDGR
jgi:glutamyl-Q tRNA(Asp) synthetase